MAGPLLGHGFESLPESLSFFPSFFLVFISHLSFSLTLAKVRLSGVEHIKNLNFVCLMLCACPPPLQPRQWFWKKGSMYVNHSCMYYKSHWWFMGFQALYWSKHFQLEYKLHSSILACFDSNSSWLDHLPFLTMLIVTVNIEPMWSHHPWRFVQHPEKSPMLQ